MIISTIEIKDLRKNFAHENGKSFPVIKDLNLSVKSGSFTTFFGPNGCGKSTLLNIVAGLDSASNGEVKVNGKSSEEIKAGFVFQNYSDSLMPWLKVWENVALGLEFQGLEEKERKELALKFLAKVNLSEHAEKFPYQLSGGQKQLTCIARALAFNPDIFLLDEPFGSLDYRTVRLMEMELLKVWQESKKTTLMVSHDVDEAILLGDQVVVLSERPAQIKKIIPIHLPRPRKLEMLQSEKFHKLRNEVLKAFEEKSK